MSRLRLVIPNLAIFALFLSARMIGRLYGSFGPPGIGRRGDSVLVAIEAGEVAWGHIFFSELEASARDYFGETAVVRLAVKSKRNYVAEVREFVSRTQPTHYFFDPRTGSSDRLRGIMQAFGVLTVLSRRGVIPIAYCTDVSVRRDRFKAAIVTAVNGICVSLSPSGRVRGMFPHDRLLGPAVMPISRETALRLRQKAECGVHVVEPIVSFYGSLYEPRKTQLRSIERMLSARGIKFDIRGRIPGGERITSSQYWEDLIGADITVSTASQVQSKGMDCASDNHLIYRYTEALACGSCLVIERAPGYDTWFEHGKNLMVWDTPEEAVDLIVYLFRNTEARDQIRKNALAWAEDAARRSIFWKSIWESLPEAPASVTLESF
jgi:hypothetical protein